MQNIGNLTPEVDAKELFMRPMIPFIQESIGRAKQYILDLIQIDQKLGESYCDKQHLVQHPDSIVPHTFGPVFIMLLFIGCTQCERRRS